MRRTHKGVMLLALLLAALTRTGQAQTTAAALENGMKPKVMTTHEGTFHCDTAPTLLVGKSLLAADAPAFAPLQAFFQTRFANVSAPTAPAAHLPASPFILIGLTHDHPLLGKLVADHKSELPKEGLGAEGYVMEVTPEHVLIAADKPAGAFYGVWKLRELNTADAATKAVSVPARTFADWPTLAWRGMHLLVNGKNDLPALETLITQNLPILRFNQLILEINYHFDFQSHPEVREGDVLTRADCQHLKEIADKNFIRLIPMINCLGHQSWAEHTAQLLTSHPDFDETPNAPADNKGLYCRSWCPSDPDVNKLVCDLIDEIIDAFNAKAFHVGMDEVFILGQCPRCKGKDNASLFAHAVNDLHAHLVGKRHVQMLMWGDRLLDGESTGYGEWEASKNGTYPAIDMIPKDIVICDWHYELRYKDAPATYPSVRYFQDKGLRVWPSAWNSVENARMLGSVALQNRTDKMVGYLATTWSGASGIVNALAGAAPPGDSENARLGPAIRKGAQIAWEGEQAAAL